MKSLLEKFEDAASRILKSGLTSYEAITSELKLEDYMLPRLFRVLGEFPQTIYRARPASNFDYWDKTQFRHPPEGCCHAMGRAILLEARYSMVL